MCLLTLRGRLGAMAGQGPPKPERVTSVSFRQPELPAREFSVPERKFWTSLQSESKSLAPPPNTAFYNNLRLVSRHAVVADQDVSYDEISR